MNLVLIGERVLWGLNFIFFESKYAENEASFTSPNLPAPRLRRQQAFAGGARGGDANLGPTSPLPYSLRSSLTEVKGNDCVYRDMTTTFLEFRLFAKNRSR